MRGRAKLCVREFVFRKESKNGKVEVQKIKIRLTLLTFTVEDGGCS